MKWKWCDPFSIDEVGVQVRIIENKGRKVTLIIEVKKLNSLQKKVGSLTCESKVFILFDERKHLVL